MKVPRYYAQHTTTVFSARIAEWQVFDRDWCSDQGEVLPIAICISRATAFRIRDTLNNFEHQQKREPTI